MIAIQELPDGPLIPSALMCNIDASGCPVIKKDSAVLVRREVKRALRAQQKSVQGVENKEKKRFVHYMPVSSADGKLVSFVAMVLDRKLPNSEIQLVSADF